MSRDTWQLRRPVIKIGKIRKKLTLPAASYSCFESKGCVSINIGPPGPLSMVQSLPAAFLLTSALSLECWVNPSFVSSNRTILGVSGKYELKILTDNRVRLTLYKGGAQNLTTILKVDSFRWSHIIATWDGVTAKIYVNTVQDVNTLALTPSLTAGGTNMILFGDGSVTLYGAEARVWDRALTYDEILFRYNHPLSAGVTDLDTGLLGYWKCNEQTGLTIYNKVVANALDFTVTALNSLITTEYPPLTYGASFVVAETLVTLGKVVSLIFPKKLLAGCTGMLCVSHTDDEGEVVNYRIWDLDGVDINPYPTTYTGQKLNSPFKLQWWNIDGNATVVIPSDIVVSVSDCTNPLTSSDQTQQVATIITMDTTLAELFPITIPATFNTQQTY